jgi:hypothetical protein
MLSWLPVIDNPDVARNAEGARPAYQFPGPVNTLVSEIVAGAHYVYRPSLAICARNSSVTAFT